MKKYIGPIWALLMVACSTTSSFQYPPVRWLRDTDNQVIAQPKVRLDHKYSQTQFAQLSEQAQDLFSFAEEVVTMPSGFVLSGKLESIDINNFDEIADSTWFTNRIGRTSTFETIFKTPPSLKKKWTVLEVDPSKDVTEFVIQDANKNHYVIKIDKDPEWLDSSGEMLGTLILSASGYNVTENYLVEFDAHILNTPVLPKGKYRALAVRVPLGVQLGHFEFDGKRKDDPNDRLAHEYRRELCGLRVFASLLNSSGISTKNTLDVYHDGYVTHYLSNLLAPIAKLNSDYLSETVNNEGHTIDALFSFGFYNPYWPSTDVQHQKYKGALSSQNFNPKKWRPDNQNLAFRYMSDRDAFWAAKILRQFTDDDIRTIVAMADYKDVKTRDRITAEIITRRNMIVSFWFQKINPLDNFRLNNGLTFDDIGLPAGTQYRFKLKASGGREMGRWTETTAHTIPLPKKIKKMIVMQMQTLRDPKRRIWSPSVEVYIENKHGLTILGIRRLVRHAKMKAGQRSVEPTS